MSNYGAPKNFQVIWRSGHVETIKAHTVSLPIDPGSVVKLGLPMPIADQNAISFYGEVDGKWTLILYALASDILSIRLLPADSTGEVEETKR